MQKDCGRAAVLTYRNRGAKGLIDALVLAGHDVRLSGVGGTEKNLTALQNPLAKTAYVEF